jgi:glutamyl-Q tRNA(Asp) synthetase
MASQPIFRFAPSPYGKLHLGNAYSALFTWNCARELGGTALLRIEDIDPARSKPEFDCGIIEDLQWLGLSWPEPVLRQSARFPVYRQAADRLRQMGLLYPCFCSRGEIAAKATGTDPDGAPLYPGTCRNLSEDEIAARMARGDPVQWRLKMDDAILAVGTTIVVIGYENIVQFSSDLTTRTAHPELWGDAVLLRKDTPTSYHLSVVVDDAAQGVTHVTRGMDLYAATDLHVLLQNLLGLSSPVYCHHKLILDAEGEQKLSKSRGSPSLQSLREEGWTPEDVRKRLGFG